VGGGSKAEESGMLEEDEDPGPAQHPTGDLHSPRSVVLILSQTSFQGMVDEGLPKTIATRSCSLRLPFLPSLTARLH
jgi:hypothetical protein